MIANTDLSIRLPDGRRLGYAEYGDPAGKPVLHFHGTPDSRLEGTLPSVAEAAARLGVRLILPDRPGIGLSDFKPGRAILDWPADVLALADALNLPRFALMGLSGGGPYAAACAYKIPQRLTRVGIISGVAPPDMPGAMGLLDRTSDGQAVRLGAKSPWLLRLVLAYTVFQFRRDPAKLVAQTAAEVSPPDQAALARGGCGGHRDAHDRRRLPAGGARRRLGLHPLLATVGLFPGRYPPARLPVAWRGRLDLPGGDGALHGAGHPRL